MSEPEPTRYLRQKESFTISTDPAKLDLDVIHGYLARSYWARGISKAIVAQSIAHSLCFGLYDGESQIGFARIVTDQTPFAYLCDVFILETYQGRGLGTWLLESILDCPNLRGLRHFMLATRDAHAFYRKQGFGPVTNPGNLMYKMGERPWFQPE
jgi:GNAT superfamily N-acetyltransferase